MTEPAGGSIAFDRAAAFYDETRGFSPATERAVAELLASELEGRGRALEVGVGTGRVALPLARAGIPMAGVDLSGPMLARLVTKGGGRAPFPLAIADATSLPFSDGTFGAAIACHVLHLIPRWADSVAEMVRVVRPGGELLIDLGSREGPLHDLRDRFGQASGRTRADVGLDGHGDLDRLMTDLGAASRLLSPIDNDRMMTLEALLAAYENNVFSFTWTVDDETRRRAVQDVRVWATERYGDLTVPRRVTPVIRWRAYDLPERARSCRRRWRSGRVVSGRRRRRRRRCCRGSR